MISKFSHSIDRQSAGRKKLFFCDSGLANTLGKPSEGQILEQSVFQTLRPHYKLNFYQKNEGSEIDFIVDQNFAIEVKTSASKRDIAHLKLRAEVLNLKNYFILSKEYSSNKETILATDL